MRIFTPGNQHSNQVLSCRYCAVDVGSSNLGVRVEDRIGTSIITVYSATTNLGSKSKKAAYDTYIPELIRYMESMRSLLVTCCHVIVEMQIKFADMCRLEGIIVGYLCALMPGNSKISVISPASKNSLMRRYFGVEINTKNAGTYALQLVNSMLSMSSQPLITSDHEADCCLMIELAVMGNI